MKLNTLQLKYVQKSKIFLYPLLGFKRGISITPIQTYINWEDKYSTNDCKLICTYHLRTDSEFKHFEQNMLLKNKYFDNFFEIDDNVGVYVFDMNELKDDYFKIISGKYSKISNITKNNILSFFQNQRNNHNLIQSYLYPEKYMEEYAELLTLGGKAKDSNGYHLTLINIKKVGELCSLLDLTQETLIANEKIINFELLNK